MKSAVLLLAVCASCASTSPHTGVAAPAGAPVKAAGLVASDPRAVPVFDGRTGAPLPWSELLQRAGAAEAVLVGENHGHPLGLAAAAAMFEDLVAAHPRASLSMEFIERDEQSRLDDWLAGLSDEATFKARTQRSEGNYPPGHRAMIIAAKDAGRPVRAANAPRSYVRLARSGGFEAMAQLTEEQRRLFVVPPTLIGGDYRAAFDAFMSGGESAHAANARFDAVYRSQSVWDWTMADAVVEGVRGMHVPLVHVVGRFHVDHEGGTVQAIRSLRPGTRIFVVSFVNEASGGLKTEDKGRGDAVVYVGPQ